MISVITTEASCKAIMAAGIAVKLKVWERCELLKDYKCVSVVDVYTMERSSNNGPWRTIYK